MTSEEVKAFAQAIAEANKHPEPAEWAAAVAEAYASPQAAPVPVPTL